MKNESFLDLMLHKDPEKVKVEIDKEEPQTEDLDTNWCNTPIKRQIEVDELVGKMRLPELIQAVDHLVKEYDVALNSKMGWFDRPFNSRRPSQAQYVQDMLHRDTFPALERLINMALYPDEFK